MKGVFLNDETNWQKKLKESCCAYNSYNEYKCNVGGKTVYADTLTVTTDGVVTTQGSNPISVDMVTEDELDALIKSGELKGEKGDQGEQGIQGEKGEKGDKGASIASGEYTVQNNKVEMDIKDTSGEVAGKVTIDNVASASDVEKERTERVEADNAINERIDGLGSKIDKLDGRVDKVGALAVAMAGLHPLSYDPEAPTEFAVAAGSYSGETAYAAGVFHHPNRDIVLSFGMSVCGSEKAGNVGATFRFGRRSAEYKAREAVKKQELAEQTKIEAEKNAKVEAQQRRHAAMAAKAVE